MEGYLMSTEGIADSNAIYETIVGYLKRNPSQCTMRTIGCIADTIEGFYDIKTEIIEGMTLYTVHNNSLNNIADNVIWIYDEYMRKRAIIRERIEVEELRKGANMVFSWGRNSFDNSSTLYWYSKYLTLCLSYLKEIREGKDIDTKDCKESIEMTIDMSYEIKGKLFKEIEDDTEKINEMEDAMRAYLPFTVYSPILRHGHVKYSDGNTELSRIENAINLHLDKDVTMLTSVPMTEFWQANKAEFSQWREVNDYRCIGDVYDDYFNPLIIQEHIKMKSIKTDIIYTGMQNTEKELSTAHTAPNKNVTNIKITLSELALHITGEEDSFNHILNHKVPKDGKKCNWIGSKADAIIFADYLKITPTKFSDCFTLRDGKKLIESNRGRKEAKDSPLYAILYHENQ